jgi:CRISPR-associated protein Csb1
MTVISAHRRLYDVKLTPVSGTRFQPTGFPDIGAARFSYPVRENGQVTWRDAIIVESAQSMANRLEAVGWDPAQQHPVPELDGLPYVRVTAADDGRYVTSSRTEPHRLASAYVKDATIDGQNARDFIRACLGLRDDTPLAPRDIAQAIMALDPLCLVHGVFFADQAWPGQPRIARVVTAFIEAIDVRDAVSGGVKRDAVRHALGEGSGGTQEGYGFVPYHRMEYTAEQIVARFSIDTAQLASYGLGDDASQLLKTIALWEMRALLDGGLRLRTACDLAPVNAQITDRTGAPLPPREELAANLRDLIGRCAELLGEGRPIEAIWNLGKQKRQRRGTQAAPQEQDQGGD